MISDYYRYLSVRNHISDLLNGKKEFDICNIYEGRVGGVGYDELRYCSFDENGQLTFESNNVHDYECGEDCYKIFTWEELTDYEKEMLYYIFVENKEASKISCISTDRFIKESSHLLNEIKAASGSSFAVPQSESFMSEIGCSKLTASSHDKADIHIVIHDLRTNMTPTLGFSIKSQLGKASTLLNPGEATNILYRVEGTKLSDEDIARINDINDHLPRMREIIDLGCNLAFADIEHTTFKNNLLFLDCCMPQFIADCLLVGNLSNSAATISKTVEAIAKKNPLKFAGSDVLSFYEHKMKVLLLDAALGMTPAKEWKGRYDANGGYLVVRKDGEIVCYHFYNRNDVEDYLYNNTRFERASRSRYNFGKLFRKEDGNVYIKLNLQIRFKK